MKVLVLPLCLNVSFFFGFCIFFLWIDTILCFITSTNYICDKYVIFLFDSILDKEFDKILGIIFSAYTICSLQLTMANTIIVCLVRKRNRSNIFA